MRAVAAALLALVFALPAAGAEPRRASLQLQSIAPLTVRGQGFGAREPVVLTLLAPRLRRSIAVRATSKGRLKGQYKLRLGRCTTFTVRATGLRGSRAILQVTPDC